MPTFRDKAVVLKVRSLRDADRQYVVFTEGHGKMSLLAKGTRRGRSKMSPHMASFGVVDIMVARGRVADRLAGASLTRSHVGIASSLRKTAAAQGFMLTVDALTRREQPDERVFGIVTEFLGALDRSPEPPQSASIGWPLFAGASIRLLDVLGFAPELGGCVRCRRPFGGFEASYYDFLHGGFSCAACTPAHSEPAVAGLIAELRRLRETALASLAFEASLVSSRALGRTVEALLAAHVDRLPAVEYMRAVG
jgi:DNA repair protein RecO (recombination protein O)